MILWTIPLHIVEGATEMGPKWNRRDVLKGLAAASSVIVLPRHLPGQQDEPIAVPQVEIQITPVSPCTFRLSMVAIDRNGVVQTIPFDGSLVQESWGPPIAVLRGQFERTIDLGSLRLEVSSHPFRATLTGAAGEVVQKIAWDQNTGHFSFLIGDGPLLGLGEGGAQFDRRGTVDLMKCGQGGYQLATHGGRVPIPWIIGTNGWAMFFHQPYGSFDLTGAEGRLQPATTGTALPLDVFLVTSREPAVIMSEYAYITGRPEMPPLWSFGYQQSHRTLASREEVLSEAKTFRERKLPCDTFIYLGTGFCPSGWNTENGSFVWNSRYVRWFQFGAFCPLFRCHGRAWKLRLPWGWDTGETGPTEINNLGGAALPDSGQLHDSRVEPICRKYLELRYRMLPYLYSTVRECATTGMPIMRALWLHFPGDPKAVACPDEYLFGKSLLIAPVVEKKATTRTVYLPRGVWYDYWTGGRIEGGRELIRPVDLETIPLYVRAGSILPLGPVKQFTSQKVDGPLSVSIYPGSDGSFLLYEDDGTSLNYRKGEWMGTQMTWNDGTRKLTLQLAPGSRMLAPERRNLAVELMGTKRNITFEGKSIELSFTAGAGEN